MDYLQRKEEKMEMDQVNPVEVEKKEVLQPQEKATVQNEKYIAILQVNKDALSKIREAIKMQNEFKQTTDILNTAEAQAHLERTEEYLLELEQLDKKEAELVALQEKYLNQGMEVSADPVLQTGQMIYQDYVKEEFGDIEQELNRVRIRKEQINNLMETKNREIQESMERFEAVSIEQLQSRQAEVNEAFAKDKTISSKKKKEKGRKRVALIKDRVVGATEETEAMRADMQHRQEMITKWAKKPPKIKAEDLELTGNEFAMVFKNKSGSSINVKAVMEKREKLRIYLNTLEQGSEEYKTYLNRLELLEKTFRIVCAANGMDMDTNDYLSAKDAKKAEMQVQYANAVYKTALANYREAVAQIQTGLYSQEERVEKLADANLQNEPQEQMEKKQISQAGKEAFMLHMNRMKAVAKNANVDKAVWEAALMCCDSYDTTKYAQKEEPLFARKEALMKETAFLSNLLAGDASAVMNVAVSKLKQLEEGGVSFANYLKTGEPAADTPEFELMKAAISLIQHAVQNNTDENLVEELTKTGIFGADSKEVYRMLAQTAVFGEGMVGSLTYMRGLDGMLQSAEKKVDDEVWGMAKRLCNNYTDEKFKDVNARRVAMAEESAQIAELLSGETKDVVKFAITKLKQAGVNLDTYLKTGQPAADTMEFAVLKIAVQMILHLQSNSKDDELINELKESGVFGTELKDIYKTLAKTAVFAESGNINELLAKNLEGMRSSIPNTMDEGMWENVKGLCHSYDANTYKSEYSLRSDISADTEAVEKVLTGSDKDLLIFANNKLAELESMDVTLNNCMNADMVMGNLAGYEQLAKVIRIINHVRKNALEKNTKEELLKAVNAEGFADEKKLFERLVEFAALENYGEYLNNLKESGTYDERRKKALASRGKYYEKLRERYKRQFDSKFNKTDISQANLADIFEEDTETKYEKQELKPLYDDNINELKEYVDGLKEKQKELQLQNRQFKLITDIGSAAKMYLTASVMKASCEKRLDKIWKDRDNALKQNAKTSQEKTKEQIKEEQKKEQALADVRESLNDFGQYVKQRDILADMIPRLRNMSVEEIETKIKEIAKIRPKTGLLKAFQTYVENKTKDMEQLEIEQKIAIVRDKYVNATDDLEKEALELEYLMYRQTYQVMYEPDVAWNKEKELKTLRDSSVRSANKELFKTTEAIYQKQQVQKSGSADDKADGKDDSAFVTFLERLKSSHEYCVKTADAKQEIMQNEMKKLVDKRDGRYDYVLSQMTKEEIQLYLNNKDNTNLMISEDVDVMMQNSKEVLLDSIEKLKAEFKPEDYEDCPGIAEFMKLAEKIKDSDPSKEELKEFRESSLAFVDARKAMYKESEQKLKDFDKKLEDAQNVLNDALEEKEDMYTESAKEKAYKNNREYVENCFKPRILNAKNLAKFGYDLYKGESETAQGKKYNHIGSLAEAKPEYTDKAKALMNEKDKDGLYGLTYNSLALQDFLTDTSEDKYEKIEYELKSKSGYKKTHDYQISKKDFTAAVLKDGITTVNFQKLMYVRNRLMEWLEEHRDLALKDEENLSFVQKIWDRARSPKQQRYDRRLERLEKLNNYLKCYSEANGVDFVTGELLCESNLTEEEVKSRVKDANLFLAEATSDMWAYLSAPEIEFEKTEEEDEEDKKEEKEEKSVWEAMQQKLKDVWEAVTEQEKELLEGYQHQQIIELNNLYAWTAQTEKTLLTHNAKKRTAHFTGELTSKLMECKAACSIGIATGTIKDKATNKESKTIGLNAQANASVALLSSEFMTEYKSKLAGMEALAKLEGKIEVGKASVNANLAATLLKDGQFNPSIQMDIGAEAALLKLEASVGAKALGVEIDANLGFIFGVAARFNVEMKDWKLKVDVGAALGIGASFALEFDFSDLKEALTEYAKTNMVHVKDYIAERMLYWNLGSNSEFVNKYFMREIEALDLDLTEVFKTYDVDYSVEATSDEKSETSQGA